MKMLETMAEVYAPAPYGETGEHLGHYAVVFSYRSAEEVESEDVQYANVLYTVLGNESRAPKGGYRRGMVLRPEDGGVYHVLTAVTAGGLWIMKALRTVPEEADYE